MKSIKKALDQRTQLRRNEAVTAFNRGDMGPMQRLCEAEIKTSQDAFCHTNLGVIYTRLGRYAEAKEVYLEGVRKFPNSAALHANLSKSLLDSRDWEGASEAAHKALEIDPAMMIAWLNASYAHNMLGQSLKAERCAREALKLTPGHGGAQNNLANALLAQGQVHEAVNIYKTVAEANVEDDLAYTNLMLALMYDDRTSGQDLKEAASNYAKRFENESLQSKKYKNSALPERRLKIGFISPDFTNHAVMYFAEPVLMRLDRSNFEIYCYFTYAAGDAVTDRVKAVADKFRTVDLRDPRKVADTIQEDEVDILIDLAGHTGKNALRVMALKPAPAQVTWLGYPGTTGLKSIDWRITDHIADPTGSDAYYSEKLVRLPGCFCVYRPHLRSWKHRFDRRYEPKKAPVEINRYITFGSCNNISKINDQTLKVWSEILIRKPDSKMLIEGKDLEQGEVKERLLNRFEAHGVDRQRITLIKRSPENQYLTYNKIDVCLDTFPLTGGATTFDALWMGVPVISILGKSFKERLSGTILVNGGFDDMLCANEQDYIQRALDFTSDIALLCKRRAEQRSKMLKSALMDEVQYVQRFSTALRLIWRNWCNSVEPIATTHGESPRECADVLVFVNGRRITLKWAEIWLAKLEEEIVKGNNPNVVESAQALSLAILQVIPDHAAAVRRIRTLVDESDSA